MFAKQDIIFDDIASDPRRRAYAIKSLSFRRKMFFWLACFTTLLFIPASFGSPNGAGPIAFCATIQWMLLFKFEADLRLLRALARLHDAQGPARLRQ